MTAERQARSAVNPTTSVVMALLCRQEVRDRYRRAAAEDDPPSAHVLLI